MDSIGLLAAWVGVVSFLIVAATFLAAGYVVTPIQRRWARTSPQRREKRIKKLRQDLASADSPPNAALFDLIAAFGVLTLTLVAGVAVVSVLVQLLDLGPSLLAANLPFDINAKLITRFTGITLFFISYFLVFRLCYLSAKLHDKLLVRRPHYSRAALIELNGLCETSSDEDETVTREHQASQHI